MTRTVSRRDRELRLIGRRRDVRRAVDEPTRGRAAGRGPARGTSSSRAARRGRRRAPTRRPRFVDGLEQRVVVDEVGARRVDEDRAVGQQADDAPVDDLRVRSMSARCSERIWLSRGELVERRRVARSRAPPPAPA